MPKARRHNPRQMRAALLPPSHERDPSHPPHRSGLRFSLPGLSSPRILLPRQTRPTILRARVVDRSLLLPRPVPSLGRLGSLGTASLWSLARRNCPRRLSRFRRLPTILAAGDRSHLHQRFLRLLGPSPATSRRLPL